MDYTTLDNVKAAMGAQAPGTNPLGASEETVLNGYITRVSRVIDRYVTRSEAGTDYLKQETVTGETLEGRYDNNGNIIAYLHKPAVTSVTAFAYRFSPIESWISVDPSYVVINNYRVTAFIGSFVRGPVYVQVTYAGGLSSTPAGLPADIIEAATVMVIRYYKEARGGLEDVIGVAEFGQPVYSKAMPARVREILSPYERPVPW